MLATLLGVAALSTAGCRFDMAGMDLADAQACNNDHLEPPEECDGSDFGGMSCADLTEYVHGALACATDCTVDTSGCHTCGNDAREPAEVCDGSDLGGDNCKTRGFSSGPLFCTADCNSFDTSQCLEVPLDWYDPEWRYRRRIEIDAGAVGADLDGFPLLVRLVDATLGSKTHPMGNDILFTAGDGLTELAHEIETFDGLAGEIVAWVNLPLLRADVATVLYLYYGNPSAQAQATAHLVWDDHYQGVWHLAEPASDELYLASHHDSTGLEHHGLQAGNNRADGRVGFGQRFDGDDDEIEVANPASFALGDASCTVSAWIRTTSTAATGILVKSPPTSHVADDKLFGINHTADKLGIDHGWVGYLGGVTEVNDGNWHHVAWVQHGDYSGTEELWELYVDGNFEASAGADSGADVAEHTLRIGGMVPDSYFAQRFRGDIDEVRISHNARSLSWLAASHANQRDPAQFYQLDSEVELSD